MEKEGIKGASKFEVSVPSSIATNLDKQNLLPKSESKGYGDSVFYWHNQQSISYEIDVPEEGLYELSFDYYPLGNGVVPIEGSILVNGEFPFMKAGELYFRLPGKTN